ncbi:MAG TPA: aldose 1-epimerase [Terracidiphilus sp.]|nr:aldose 1-epimerase [Terracidiphilus sp.]
MKLSLRAYLLTAIMPALVASCGVMNSQAQNVTEIGGQKIVTLTRPVSSKTKPEFTSVTVLPGRGMELFQITANFPGKGSVDVLASPSLEEAKKMLDEQDTPNGDLGYRLGSAFLFPYPNRIRGKLSADSKTLTTSWQGHTITLPANNIGSKPDAERHAMHGLILKAKTVDVKEKTIPGGKEISGTIHGGDFGGHWLSKSDLVITISLTADAIDATVTAKNVGKEAEPVSIGWHPYFNFPSGDRTQVRLQIPADMVAKVDNYDNVFPTGQLVPVSGQYDLRNGQPLYKNFYDDNWSHLDWKDGAATVNILDEAAKYGVRIQGLSPEIKTIQAYAPPAKNFVAVEHQFNFADPFGKEWGNMDTGMVTLQPGQSTNWHVRLKLFVP